MKAAKRARIYARDGHRCVHCGNALNLTLDHIIPVSRGGGDHDSNLQTLCVGCNQKKGAKVPEGFVPPKRKRTKMGRLRDRFGSALGLHHHRLCDPNYCFCECPVYLSEHPELARSLAR